MPRGPVALLLNRLSDRNETRFSRSSYGTLNCGHDLFLRDGWI